MWKVEECLASKYLKPHFEEEKQVIVKLLALPVKEQIPTIAVLPSCSSP